MFPSRVAGSSEKTRKGKDIAAAVSSMVTVKPGGRQSLEFALTWDMPVIHFRAKEIQYSRWDFLWCLQHSNTVKPAYKVLTGTMKICSL